jgi:protein-tyrosine phosphatase
MSEHIESPTQPTPSKANLSIFHRGFDRFYPLIRYFYERIRGHAWFSQINANLWLGGAPDFPRDYQFLLDHGISAVVNIRAEREDDTSFYQIHQIDYISFKTPDVAAPDPDTIDQAVQWMQHEIAGGRTVLVHCAKGRGRSATLTAAYLMAAEGLSLDQAVELLENKRRLTKIEARHRQVLAAWSERFLPYDSSTGKTG